MSFHVLLQVVGLRSGWHTALVMGKFNRRIHATRLAQTRRVVLTASAAGAQDAQTYMQMDGEPWPQMVPGRGKEPLRVGPLFFCLGRRVFVTGGTNMSSYHCCHHLTCHDHCGIAHSWKYCMTASLPCCSMPTTHWAPDPCGSWWLEGPRWPRWTYV